MTINLPSDLTGDLDTGELTLRGAPAPPEAWAEIARWLRDELGLSAAELAERTWTDGRNVRRWCAGERLPDPRSRRLLLALAREVVTA